MAYYEGGTLKERIRPGGMDCAEARAIVAQIASGLAAASTTIVTCLPSGRLARRLATCHSSLQRRRRYCGRRWRLYDRGMLKGVPFLLALATAPFARDSTNDAAQVWNLEKAYWEYVKANDLEKYRALWHEDFVG